MDHRREQGKDSIYWNVYKQDCISCDSILIFPYRDDSIINSLLHNPKFELKGIETFDNGTQLMKYVIHK